MWDCWFTSLYNVNELYGVDIRIESKNAALSVHSNTSLYKVNELYVVDISIELENAELSVHLSI